MDRKAMYRLSYGLFVLTAREAEKDNGCIINTAIQAASEPNQLSICVNKTNYTHDMIERTGKFAISILSENTDPGIIGTFGFQSGKNVNKFDSVSYKTVEGLPVIEDACAYIVCQVVNKMETDSHTVFLGKVLDADNLENAPAMTYSYYHTVVKGKSPKNAPTYLKEEETIPKTAYVCSVCGYVYEGETPFEELPDDWKCPICKQPKSVFKKQER